MAASFVFSGGSSKSAIPESLVVKIKRTKRGKIGYIPAETVVKILQLLPMESILSCKRVSKQWRNLINDPDFYKHYLPGSSISFTHCEGSFYCLLIRSNARKISGTVNGRDHPPFTMHRLPTDSFQDPPLESKYRPCLLKSDFSGGLVCLLFGDWNFCFYNLFTGRSFRVVDAPRRKKAVANWLFFGFGYNRYADDYKIMVVCKYDANIDVGNAQIQNKDNSLYWVYSFTDSAWKALGGFPYAAYRWPPDMTQACAFRGMLHWVAMLPEGEDEGKLVIATYDLHTCKFGEISALNGCIYKLFYWPPPVLAVLDGKICCWIDKLGEGTYELVVMEEYGVPGSWTTLICVSKEIAPFKNWYSTFKVPLMLYQCREGKKRVLFVTHKDGSLSWYNIDTGKISPIHKGRWQKRMMKQPKITN